MLVKPVIKYIVVSPCGKFRKGGSLTDNINRAKTYASSANAQYGVYGADDKIVPVEVILRIAGNPV